MSLTLYQVDAFTSDIFAGNPAGVCIADERLLSSDRLMQAIASEMNLPETAFLRPSEKGYVLRWFTPSQEVPLCGHATLSAAHILWETGAADDAIVFDTCAGNLTARRKGSLIELDFPSAGIIGRSADRRECAALGVTPVFCGAGGEWVLLECEDEQALVSLSPDFSALKKAGPFAYIVTCRSSSDDADFCSRVFIPSQGIDEDPVTGSAHCVLAPYWAAKLGMTVLRARQLSARGGRLECECAGGRVLLRGQARTVFDITMRIEL